MAIRVQVTRPVIRFLVRYWEPHVNGARYLMIPASVVSNNRLTTTCLVSGRIDFKADVSYDSQSAWMRSKHSCCCKSGKLSGSIIFEMVVRSRPPDAASG
jgi:hypothetical protein